MSGGAPPPLPEAQLIQRSDPGRPLKLDPRRPLSIGRDPANGLSLPGEGSLSRRHAEIRPSPVTGQWLICDLGSANGTYVGIERVRDCRALADGDLIRLGRRGPQLKVQLAGGPAVSAGGLEIEGQRIAAEQVRSVEVHSAACHPQLFSWWVLAALGGLMLLPFALLFWLWEAMALVGALQLARRRRHTLVVVLRDGRAQKHSFANRRTAQVHCNGIRKAVGLPPMTTADAG